MKRLIEYDPLTKTKVWHEYDHLTDMTYIHTEQDIQPIIERNKLLYKEDNKQGVKKNWWHVGTIPNNIISKWLIEEGIDFFNKDHWQAVRKKMNSSEYRYLRTSEGKV